LEEDEPYRRRRSVIECPHPDCRAVEPGDVPESEDVSILDDPRRLHRELLELTERERWEGVPF
jgi:hypothetical protein